MLFFSIGVLLWVHRNNSKAIGGEFVVLGMTTTAVIKKALFHHGAYDPFRPGCNGT